MILFFFTVCTKREPGLWVLIFSATCAAQWKALSGIVSIPIRMDLKQFGRLSGLNIPPPLRLSVPYITGLEYSFFLWTGTKQEYLRNGGMDGNGMKWKLIWRSWFWTGGFDNSKNNLSPFMKCSSRKPTPSYQEGTEIFNKGGLFYSRRVGATPSGYYGERMGLQTLLKSFQTQVKGTDKCKQSFGRTRTRQCIGVVNVNCCPYVWEIEYTNTKTRERIQTSPLTNYNLIVFDRALKNRSLLL